MLLVVMQFCLVRQVTILYCHLDFNVSLLFIALFNIDYPIDLDNSIHLDYPIHLDNSIYHPIHIDYPIHYLLHLDDSIYYLLDLDNSIHYLLDLDDSIYYLLFDIIFKYNLNWHLMNDMFCHIMSLFNNNFLSILQYIFQQD